MKKHIKILKKKFEQYLEPLSEECELLPIAYTSLEMFLEYNISDKTIKEWLKKHQNSLHIIEKTIQNYQNQQDNKNN